MDTSDGLDGTSDSISLQSNTSSSNYYVGNGIADTDIGHVYDYTSSSYSSDLSRFELYIEDATTLASHLSGVVIYYLDGSTKYYMMMKTSSLTSKSESFFIASDHADFDTNEVIYDVTLYE